MHSEKADRILALRENYFASVDERQRCLAEDWGCICNPDNGMAVVSVTGPTRASYWGAGTYSRLRATIEGLLAQDSVSQIVLEINSPGGDVNGLFECCEYIAKAKDEKPIHAHVTGMCCSAAFAIASACTDISATQTSEIGSVGVYAQAYDDSEFLKKEGILARIFRSRNAEKKNASPFSEEGAADIQAKIDFYEDCFYTVLSEGRNMDRERCIEFFGHGAVFLAEDALERSMIDSIVSYDELIDRLSSPDNEEEDEGDDDMDIATMTAEQKAELFNALVADNPSLLAEAEGTARESERNRVTGLFALRTDANKDLVDNAINEGKKADDIMGDLYRAEKERADKLAADMANLDAIRAQAENEQTPQVSNPMPDDLGAQADRIAKRVTEARK